MIRFLTACLIEPNVWQCNCGPTLHSLLSFPTVCDPTTPSQAIYVMAKKVEVKTSKKKAKPAPPVSLVDGNFSSPPSSRRVENDRRLRRG